MTFEEEKYIINSNEKTKKNKKTNRVIQMADRRIKRTKGNIYSALSSLLFEKNIRNITVKELCEKADVNKSTFYLHFMDIYDCKEKWQDEIFEEVLSKVNSFNIKEITASPETYISAVVNYFNDNISFFERLVKSQFAAEFSYNLKQRIREKIIESNGLDLENNQYEITLVAFIMGGILDSCIINIENFDTRKITETLNSISDTISDFIKTQLND